MCVGIINIFNPKKPVDPCSGCGACEIMQVHFKSVINHFGLPIHLRVIKRAKIELDALELEELLPEMASKSRVSIIDDGHWKSMQFEPIFKKT